MLDSSQILSDMASQHGFFLWWALFSAVVVGPVLWIRRDNENFMTPAKWRIAIGLGLIAMCQLIYAFVWRMPLMPLLVLVGLVVVGVMALRQK